MNIHINEILDVITTNLKLANTPKLKDRFKEDLELTNLDLRDIVYFLELECSLFGGNLWNIENLIEEYPSIEDLISFYECYYNIDGMYELVQKELQVEALKL